MNHKSTLLASLFAASLLSVASADQSFIDLGQEDYSTWDLYGSAVYESTTTPDYIYRDIQLTTAGVGSSAGAAFAHTPITMNLNQSFMFDFPFFIRPGNVTRGDGMTFVLAGSPGVGGGGSGLGYSGLNGVAFGIDTFHFEGEPVSPSLQILKGGSSNPVAYTETGLGDNIRDQNLQWIGGVMYTPSGNNDELGTLAGTIWRPDFGLFSVSTAVDLSVLGNAVFDPDSGDYLGRSLYYGFTGANGLADDGHIVTSAVLVPAPAAAWLFGPGMLGLIGAKRRRT